MSNAKEYVIVLDDGPWERMWSYVHECPDEVAAFGYIKPDEKGYLVVDELFLVPQEVCGTEVDFVSDGLPYAVNKAAADGRSEDLRFCVHSHVNMGTGFSSTDDNMIEKVGAFGTPWFASAIFNKKGETNGRVDIFTPGLPLPGCEQVEVKATVTTWKHEHANAEAKSELAEFVKKKVNQATPTQASWTKPMKQTAGTGHGQGTFQGHDTPMLDAGDNWWEDELEDELALYIQGRRESWETIEDTDGKVHFFDANGDHKGVAEFMDESTVDWFISRGWAREYESDDDIPEGSAH